MSLVCDRDEEESKENHHVQLCQKKIAKNKRNGENSAADQTTKIVFKTTTKFFFLFFVFRSELRKKNQCAHKNNKKYEEEPVAIAFQIIMLGNSGRVRVMFTERLDLITIFVLCFSIKRDFCNETRVFVFVSRQERGKRNEIDNKKSVPNDRCLIGTPRIK